MREKAVNPLNRQWFFKGFHKKLTDTLGKADGDQLWHDAGDEYSRILASQPELKRHKGALTLPAVALYRVLTARGEDAEGLLNAYGEDMGKRFARIIYALTSLPGADRLTRDSVRYLIFKSKAFSGPNGLPNATFLASSSLKSVKTIAYVSFTSKGPESWTLLKAPVLDSSPRQEAGRCVFEKAFGLNPFFTQP